MTISNYSCLVNYFTGTYIMRGIDLCHILSLYINYYMLVIMTTLDGTFDHPEHLYLL